MDKELLKLTGTVCLICCALCICTSYQRIKVISENAQSAVTQSVNSTNTGKAVDWKVPLMVKVTLIIGVLSGVFGTLMIVKCFKDNGVKDSDMPGQREGS